MGWGPRNNGASNNVISAKNSTTFVASRSYRADFGNYTTTSSDLKDTYRLQHIALVNCFDVSAVYDNIAGSNPITVTASLEDASGNIYPLTFSGSSSVTLAVGQVVTSDPVGIEYNKGDVFFSRSCVSVTTSGQVWQLGATATLSGEGRTAGDITVSGTPTTTNEHVYSPLAIIGKTASSVSSVILVGDSIMSGFNTSRYLSGYEQAMIDSRVPYTKVSHGGETALTFSTPSKRSPYMLLSEYATHAIVQYGVNDLNANETLANIQNYLQAIWNALDKRGIKVYQATVTPYTTSTDSWATLTNQVAYSTDYGGTNSGTSLGTSVRTQLNDWIRTVPSPLTGYIEVADALESSRNSGLWRVDVNVTNGGGGVHPDQTGHNYIEKTIDTNALLNAQPIGKPSNNSTPAGLTATPGDTQVSLSWTASTNQHVMSYNIYRGGTKVGNSTSTSYTDTGLTDGTSYSYQVSSVDVWGQESSLSSSVSATPVQPPSIVYDTFTRANSTTTMGSTESGSAGVLAWTPLSGTWGIISGQAYLAAAASDQATVVNSGVSDCTVQVTFSTLGGANQRMVFRATDNNNYWQIQTSANGSTYQLYKRVSGSWTSVGAASGSAKNGDIVRAVLSGSSITVYVNGVQIATTSDTFNQTATQHGLGSSGTSNYFDNFKVY